MLEVSATDFVSDFSPNRQSCRYLYRWSEEARYPAQEVEGHLLWARYAALEQSVAGISQGSKVPPTGGDGKTEQRLPAVAI